MSHNSILSVACGPKITFCFEATLAPINSYGMNGEIEMFHSLFSFSMQHVALSAFEIGFRL